MGVIKRFHSLGARFRGGGRPPAPAPTVLAGDFRCFWRAGRHASPWTSSRRSDQVANAHQILGGRRPSKHPPHPLPAPVPHLAHQRHGLHPPEDFFDSFTLLLAYRLARVTAGSGIDGAAAVGIILRHRRRGSAPPHLLHPLLGVIVLVAAHRDPLWPRAPLDHLRP